MLNDKEISIVQEKSAGYPLFEHYKYHIFVFLIALFIALAFAHPQLLVTDEWVTANQLAQIHSGNQVLVSEGKYGVYENGTITPFFIARNNLLGYTIFLPLISLPAHGIVDIFGNQFPYVILILWTLIPIIIAMGIKCFMNDPEILGKWRLTTVLFIGSFLLFFINLFYYIPFPVTGIYSYPEIEAIVFTNILCYAILAVLIYEILVKIFNDSRYSLFGTAVCLSCSSYLIWSTCTKDHMLVALLYGALLVSVVYFYEKRDRWFFPVSCLLTGLIAWARPELALPTFIGTVAFFWVTYRPILSFQKGLKDFFFMILSPFFVLIGALPFFVNNYLITSNPFVPTWVIWGTGNSQNASTSVVLSSPLMSGLPTWTAKIMQLFLSEIAIHPDTFFGDLYGVLFNPQNGSMGIFCITPLVLIAVFLIPVIILVEKNFFSQKERFFLFSMIYFSALVFIAYITKIYGMNISPGIVPDIRYLSPAYLSLNIAGLIVLKKLHDLSENPGTLIKNMLLFVMLITPIVLVFIVHYYPYSEQDPTSFLFTPLNTAISIGIYVLMAVFLLMQVSSVYFQKQFGFWKSLVISAILCLPFVWQVATTFLMRIWGSGLGGYSFWIPIIRVLYSFLFSIITMQ
jgi:hypothetical protein